MRDDGTLRDVPLLFLDRGFEVLERSCEMNLVED